jgi:hypothetical protein
LRKRNYAFLNAMPDNSNSDPHSLNKSNKIQEHLVSDIEYSIFELDQVEIDNDETW